MPILEPGTAKSPAAAKKRTKARAKAASAISGIKKTQLLLPWFYVSYFFTAEDAEKAQRFTEGLFVLFTSKLREPLCFLCISVLNSTILRY